MRRFTPAAILAATGLATAAATAQPTWETRIGFAQTINGPLLPGNSLVITATGTYTFIVRAGIFNLSGLQAGQSNQGVSNWTGNIAAAGRQPGEGLAVSLMNARIAPFLFGPPGCGFPGCGGGALLHYLNAARDVAGGASAPWLWDSAIGAPGPMPAAPVPGAFGVESLTNVFRFTYTVTTLNGPNIVIRAAGTAGPVLQWLSNLDNEFFPPPVPPTGPAEPGRVNFIGLIGLPLQPYTPTTLTIPRCGGDVTHPVPRTVSPGVSTTLSVAVPSPNTVFYQWRRAGVNLSDSDRISGSTTPTLTINTTQFADTALYDCLITGPCPAPFLSDPAQLTVRCRGDRDNNGTNQPADVVALIQAWNTDLVQNTRNADFDANGQVDPSDVALFVATWFHELQHGC